VVLRTRARYRAPGSLYYEVAANGLFQVRSTALYRAVTRVESGVPGLLPASEDLELLFPRVPAALLGDLLAFFRDAWRTLGGEAVAVLFYRDGEFRVGIPPQWISGTRDRRGAFRPRHHLRYGAVERPEGFVRLGTLHSHADLPAYSSAVDRRDEMWEDGLHVVFGHLHTSHPSRCASFVANGVRFPLHPDEVLEPCELPERAARPEWLGCIGFEEETAAGTEAGPGEAGQFGGAR
jgi:proteasome lid subunit RPN8/RPN11